MPAPLLSYIVVSYNQKDSIVKSLDSIYALPLSNEELEVIVVDDHSSDGTQDVLKAYALNHPNLHLIFHDRNQRQGAARNHGIDASTGRYIAFCDGDDTIGVSGVIDALNILDKSDCEICYYGLEYQQEDGLWAKYDFPTPLPSAFIPTRDFLERYYSFEYGGVWRHVINASFLKSTGFRMAEGVRWEDRDWDCRVLASSTNIAFVEAVGYKYSYCYNSASSQNDPQAMLERLEAGLRLHKVSEDYKQLYPGFSSQICNESLSRFIKKTLRFKNLVKYKASDIFSLQQFLDLRLLRKDLLLVKMSRWNEFFMKHRFLSSLILFCLHPVAMCFVKIVRG